MKKIIIFLVTFLLFSTTAFASENIQHQNITVSVYNLSSDNNKPIENAVFTLYAGEDIYNTANEVIIPKDTSVKSVTTDKNGLAQFVFSVPIGRYYIKQMAVPSGYVIDNMPIDITINEGQSEYNETIYNTYRDGNLLVDLATDESASVGNNYKVGISVKNNSPLKANNFIMIAEIPLHTQLQNIVTGKYNQESIISVYFKTNLSTDWLLWRSIMSSESTILSVQDISLPDNAYIKSIMIDYGNVDAAFQSVPGEGIVLDIVPGATVAVSDILTHNISLTGYIDGTKSSCHVHADITVIRNENEEQGELSGAETNESIQGSNSIVSPVATSQQNEDGKAGASPETGDSTVFVPFIIAIVTLIAIAIVTIIMIAKRKKH